MLPIEQAGAGHLLIDEGLSEHARACQSEAHGTEIRVGSHQTHSIGTGRETRKSTMGGLRDLLQYNDGSGPA